MCDSCGVDSTGALAHLEAVGPSADGVGVPTRAVPSLPVEAVSQWLAAVGVRPGMTLSPRALPLAGAFHAYARAQGWDVEVSLREVGRAFALAGCQRSPGGGYRVSRDAAVALWRAVGGKPKGRPSTSRPKRKPPRVTRHPTKPLRACDGRMWRSQRDAMASLGVNAMAICRAVRYGTSVAGVHLRFATPAEVVAWRGEEWDGGIGSPS